MYFRLATKPIPLFRLETRSSGYITAAGSIVHSLYLLHGKACKLACHPVLARAVSAKLRRKWSPEQIAAWLKRNFKGEAHKQVSHETIHRSLY
jgi:IS30 family transposase